MATIARQQASSQQRPGVFYYNGALQSQPGPSLRTQAKNVENIVYLLWLEKEMPEGPEDIELLIGVYSSEAAAKAAIERLRDKRGFVDFPEGFNIYPCELDKDSWLEGFIVDLESRRVLPASLSRRGSE